MSNPYADGNFAWYWYQAWLPVIASIGSLAILIYVFSYPVEKIHETIAKVAGVTAFLGTLPMSLVRIGIGVDIVVESMFALNVLGLIASGAIGYAYTRSRKRFLDRSDFVDQDVDNEDYGGYSPTMTQYVDESDATPQQGTLIGETREQPQAFVLVKSGPQSGTSIPITKGETLIGRSSDADIVLDDKQVSRDHARIAFTDGQFTLIDSGSSAGTMVDGELAETVALDPGAELKLGETEIVFMQGESTFVPGTGSNSASPFDESNAEATILGVNNPNSVMKWIAITDGPEKGKTFQLKEGRISIGREEVNDIRLSDATVSREHAVILNFGSELKLVDLGSAAGTSIDGEPVAGGKVVPGDIIQVGQDEMAIVPVDSVSNVTPRSTGASDMTVVTGAAPDGIGAVLVVRSGPDAGESFQLSEGDNSVGRDASNKVILADNSVSRKHAVLRKRGDFYAIYDLDSSAGTRINEQPVEGIPVKTGQLLKFGSSTAVIMEPTTGQA
jgi:pSer/pThr/pTyr-binding forkhead associated (FHA) protein